MIKTYKSWEPKIIAYLNDHHMDATKVKIVEKRSV